MASSASLLDFAHLAGIAPTYVDAFGAVRAVDAGAVRAILEAMGFDTTDDSAAVRDLRTYGLRDWLDGLAPVKVALATGPLTLAFSHREEEADVRHAWSLTFEDGTSRTGDFVPEALESVDTLTIEGTRFERRRLVVGDGLPLGYHDFRIETTQRGFAMRLIVSPGACYLPPALEAGERVWGLAVQLYGLRSAGNAGIGNFSDLAELACVVRAAGGSAVGLNPLHFLEFAADVNGSPYSPSSRTAAGWHYLDVTKLPGFVAEDLDAAAVARARAVPLIDYGASSAYLWDAISASFARFERSGASDDVATFDAFVRAGGRLAYDTATFCALVRDSVRHGKSASWPDWPAAYRDRQSPEVQMFSETSRAAIRLELFAQWQADVQLAAAASAAPMAVGLYRDLAVGAMPDGAETWAGAGSYRAGVTIGAPPDLLNRRGQNWGIAPFDPNALREKAYAPFVDLLRANMRHAGALRIDHVMGLTRLYWIPLGSPPSHGAYVTYDVEDLLGIVALESVRNRCLVVGEDLGTVPDGFRDMMAKARVLSYRILPFETAKGGAFLSPDRYPELSLVATGTHDLPTVAAYVTGADIDVRAEIEGESGETAAAHAERQSSVGRLAEALEATLGEEAASLTRALSDGTAGDSARADVARLTNAHLARSPSLLQMVQLEDVAGDLDQANLPGTLIEHPNWRRRATIALEDLAADDRFRAVAEALGTRRLV